MILLSTIMASRTKFLTVPKKRKRLYHKDSSIVRLRPTHQSHIWSIDFVHDKLSNGRPYKMLTVLDEYTRQGLCVAVKFRMGSAEVLEALYPLLLKYGTPEYIRSDNVLYSERCVDLGIRSLSHRAIPTCLNFGSGWVRRQRTVSPITNTEYA